MKKLSFDAWVMLIAVVAVLVVYYFPNLRIFW
jgi:hypothetical protein